jgi:hypothetical protein
MKKNILSIFITLLAFSAVAQELNCTVTVLTPQIQGTERDVFDTMESTIFEFMNNQQWSNDVFDVSERIECNLLLTINEGSGTSTSFKGKLQVQSFRPVFNSNLKSQVINLVDNDIEFGFLPNSVIRFTPEYFTDNLTSILAFYGYMIIGYDYDTYGLEGGTKYFNLAQQVVNNAQSAPQTGWKGFEGNRNRSWLVDNILHQSFKPLRNVLYQYHRHGLDVMYEDLALGRVNILTSLEGLRTVHQIKPLSYNVMVFFLAKKEELVNIYTKAPAAERAQIYKLVQSLDPSNLTIYSPLNSGG